MLDIDQQFHDTLVSRTILHASALNTVFQYLQNLYILNDPADELTPYRLRDVLGIPSLRSLRGYNIDFGGVRISPHPRVKELVLEYDLVRCPRSISTLLRAYAGLELLSLQSGYPALTEEEGPIVNYSGIGDTLRQLGTNLLSLDIRLYDSEAGSEDDDLEDKTLLGSLVALTSLQRLRLGYDALYGGVRMSNERPVAWLREILPLSLESLEITDIRCEEQELLNKQVKALVGDDRFFKLGFVSVRRDIPPEDDDFVVEDVREGWEVASQAACIELWKTGSVMRRRTAESDEDKDEEEE